MQTGLGLACQHCGRMDSTLRVSVFTWVLSIVILSWRNKVVGVWCDVCRRRAGYGYAARTLLLGPWGIPFGIIWALMAIVSDLGGGEQPKELNAELLHSVGSILLRSGEETEGIHALE